MATVGPSEDVNVDVIRHEFGVDNLQCCCREVDHINSLPSASSSKFKMSFVKSLLCATLPSRWYLRHMDRALICENIQAGGIGDPHWSPRKQPNFMYAPIPQLIQSESSPYVIRSESQLMYVNHIGKQLKLPVVHTYTGSSDGCRAYAARKPISTTGYANIRLTDATS